MVQIFDASPKVMARINNQIKKDNYDKIEDCINWIATNTQPRNQWEVILLLAYLTNLDKNHIERRVRKKRNEKATLQNI